MQTIWLQRSSPDIPWGFRLVGGREFGVPLSVQRVTPGSVAASAIGPGDVILKVGNVMTTNLEHNDAQELVRQATNILQLTIRKSADPSASDLQSPAGPGYGNYMSSQINDNAGYGTTPRSFGTGIPVSPNYNRGNEPTNYATTPRNYGSQHQQPVTGTRIEIQRVNPAQQQSGYNNNCYYNDDNVNTGGSNFPDYTIAYRKQDPIHDSPGGPVNIRVYNPPSENTSYSSKSLPRDAGGYNSGDREGSGGASGPPAYEPRAHTTTQSSFSPRAPAEARFNTGVPFQPNAQKAHQSYIEPAPQNYQNSYNSTPSEPAYGYAPFSPTSSGHNIQRYDTSSTPAFSGRDQAMPSGSHFNQTPSYGRDSNVYDQSNVRGSVDNTYQTQAYSKPAYASHNDDIDAYNNAAQYHPSQKAYTPTQATSNFETPSAFSPTQTQSKPYQSYISPGISSGYPPAPPASNRRVSFDQNIHENDHYSHPGSYTAHQYKSPPPHSVSNQGHQDYGVHDSGISSSSSGRFSRQTSRHDDPYSAMPYAQQGGPLSPRSEMSGYGFGGGAGGYDPSGVSAAMENINFSPRFEPPAPPPPPPPPPPGPPPPPAPPLSDWSSTPYKRQNYKQRDEPEEQRIPDQILNTMLKSAKGGGPKPFSYGIDLSELKKKIGPPTAPKPRPGQPNYEEDDDEQDMPRQYGGPPRKPAGYVQSDYFISRGDDQDPAQRSNKKPAGLVQADYYPTRQTGPRSEVDESPININMGTDPKKQSKSFKVLQWMTETDKEDPEGKNATGAESGQKPKRTKDPQRRHNAADDEMRFSGLHSKEVIPSKAFGMLQRMSSVDSGTGTQNGKDTFGAGDADERVGNYDETSIRYKGNSIPSPSFRVLQSWAQSDPSPNPPVGASKEEEEDDDLPETLNSDDMVDRRYRGGNIPSKVFKCLQKSVGDDTPDAPSPPIRKPPSGGQPVPKSAAPVSDF